MTTQTANALRFLSMDTVQAANSGHPGAPMGMADMADVLWREFLRHNPKNPKFANRDRFVLSNGHASALLYSLLHLSGYNLSTDDLKNFRQLHSKTPGHPEYGYTDGVETTTGPLGQGIANAVGMALAEKLLAATFNRDGFSIVNHHTYVFLGDGCLMEGISHEAASLAGTLGLGKLIVLYDDNNISIDGKVDGWFTENIPERFKSYGWHVVPNVDGHNPDAIRAAIAAAQAETGKPSIICCKTLIGKGAATKEGSHKTHGAPLGAEEIAEIVSRMTGIPVSKMMEGEREKLLKMEDVLHRRVVGQDEAVRAVSDAIRRSRSGLSDPNKPYGSFLFLGPTGVGKTELCKALAGFLFDSEDHLIRIDMSEYMEKHSIARLIGAPPGYVGYEEGGYLTEQVRRKPYSVILLDEVEKAHPDVFNILLQVLDDGRLTDGQGRTVDFKNTVIVMTSNIGSQAIQAMGDTSDYDAVKAAVMEDVKAYFRPELINRIDEVVVFHGLNAANIRSIAQIQLGSLKKRLAEQNLRLEVSEAALDVLAQAGFDPVYGARPLKRAIQAEIENPLAKALLEGRYAPESTIRVEARDGELVFA